jgi:hypothetical protein
VKIINKIFANQIQEYIIIVLNYDEVGSFQECKGGSTYVNNRYETSHPLRKSTIPL